MKPYTLTLTSEEAALIRTALQKGKFYASQCADKGMIGAEADVVRIIRAQEMFGSKQYEGGPETEAERIEIFIKRMEDECARYGCD